MARLEDEPKTRTFERTSLPEPELAITHARLTVIQGVSRGLRHAFGDVALVGRSATCSMSIDDSMASRMHVEIRRTAPGVWQVADLGSRNGTHLNEEPLVEARTLQFGDRIQIGNTVLLFSPVDPAEAQAEYRERLQVLGRLGAGLAHDLNNVIGAILTHTECAMSLLEGAPNQAELVSCLEDVREAAWLGASLTKSVLGWTRHDTYELRQVNLSLLVTQTLELLRHGLPRGVRLQSTVAPDLQIRGEQTKLQQLVMSLVATASDAMPNGGAIEVTLDVAAPSTVDHREVAVAGHHARLVVRAPEVRLRGDVRAHLFDPFFDGGLTAARDVVTSHGGSIECSSEVGRGMELRVLLPALVAGPRLDMRTPFDGVPTRAAPPRQLGTVLVVDDEPLSRRGLSRLLSHNGYEVTLASDGAEAVTVFERDPDAFDVVLMDLDMPEMGGDAALRRMRAVRPDVRVVLITGFVSESRKAALVEEGAVAVLLKPCDTDVLRQVLAGDPSP
jgi:CheY-like chemotaxis protein